MLCFFFNDTATTEIYTLSLHDALPICARVGELAVGRRVLPPLGALAHGRLRRARADEDGAPLDQRRVDGGVLLPRRPRDQARDARRRARVAAPGGAPDRGGGRRDARPRGHLRSVQRGGGGGGRLGDPDG